MSEVTITDLDELYESVLSEVERKFGNYPTNHETKWRAELHAKKLLAKWVSANCRLVGKNLWRLDLANGISFIFRRFSLSLRLEPEFEARVFLGNFVYG